MAEIQATQTQSSLEDVLPESDSGATPLQHAANEGNPNPTSDSGATPLHQAAGPLHKAAQIGLTVEMVDKLSIPELKLYLEDVNISTSGKGAGTGGLSRLLKSRLKQFLLSNNSSPVIVNDADISANQDINQGWFEDLQLNGKLLSRIPKGARVNCSKAYCKVLNELVKNPDKKENWRALIFFAQNCLSNPNRGGRKKNSLATVVNKKIVDFEKGTVEKKKPQNPGKKKFKPPTIANLVASKMAAADVKGAVRLASSDDSVLKPSPEIKKKLEDKHPKPPDDTVMPPFNPLPGVVCDRRSVLEGIRSFPPGSSGGPDRLKPQHLKDMTEDSLGEDAKNLLDALVLFFNEIVFKGKVPMEACAFFYGGNLIALSKKCGGIRPIAIGNTLRRLASKIAMSTVTELQKELFWPHQLGVGVKLGGEIACHAIREFVTKPIMEDQLILKTDFSNAYNCLRRDTMLERVQKHAPTLYCMAWQAYSSPSNLIFGDEGTILSQSGIQQGDPMGSFLFALTTRDLMLSCKSPLNAWYLDDVVLGGQLQSVKEDLNKIVEAKKSLGLTVNFSKCELMLMDSHIDSALEFPGIKLIQPEELTLLGAPVLPSANGKVLGAKLVSLKTLTERLKQLHEHDALYLLKNCMAIPKLLYFLRTAPCFLNPELLAEYDEAIKIGLENILNVKMTDQIWDQASLPTKLGGFGIRKTTELAISGYLSSVSAVEQGVKDLLGYDPNLTPLHIATQNPTLIEIGSTAFHDALLENSQNDPGLTPLHIAAQNPTLGENGSTAFHDASLGYSQNVGLTQLHLDVDSSTQNQDDGEDANSMRNLGGTPLHHAAENGSDSFFELAKKLWQDKVGNSAELPKNPKSQKEWDMKMCHSTFDRLMEAASNSPHERARLMAISSKNASDWLNCLPLPSLGLKLNPSQLKIASALRLGAPVCRPFKCFYCSDEVSSLGRHGLHCNMAAGKSGRFPRHFKANDIIRRALALAGFPAKLEPQGLAKDGSRKHPDGYTYDSFKTGKPLAWDFTCSDSLAPSHIDKSSMKAGKTAAWAEDKKFTTYGNALKDDYHFVPIAVETFGTWGSIGHKFITDIGRTIAEITKNPKSTSFIFQAISMAVQRGNVQCVQGAYGESAFEELDEIFYILQPNCIF